MVSHIVHACTEQNSHTGWLVIFFLLTHPKMFLFETLSSVLSMITFVFEKKTIKKISLYEFRNSLLRFYLLDINVAKTVTH